MDERDVLAERFDAEISYIMRHTLPSDAQPPTLQPQCHSRAAPGIDVVIEPDHVVWVRG